MNLVILKVYLSNKTILKNLQSKIRYISIKLPIICFMQVNLSHHSYNQVTFLSLFETDFLCRLSHLCDKGYQARFDANRPDTNHFKYCWLALILL